MSTDIGLTEHQIQDSIMGYLRAKGYYVQRMNSGKIASYYKGKKRLINMAEVGTPDIMAFKSKSLTSIENKLDGNDVVNHWNTLELLFVEVKRKGNKTTLHQDMKMQELTGYGARCLIAYSVDDLGRNGI